MFDSNGSQWRQCDRPIDSHKRSGWKLVAWWLWWICRSDNKSSIWSTLQTQVPSVSHITQHAVASDRKFNSACHAIGQAPTFDLECYTACGLINAPIYVVLENTRTKSGTDLFALHGVSKIVTEIPRNNYAEGYSDEARKYLDDIIVPNTGKIARLKWLLLINFWCQICARSPSRRSMKT